MDKNNSNDSFTEITCMIKEFMKKQNETFSNMYNSISIQKIEKFIYYIQNCKGNIILSGCGTSGTIARKIVHTFCCINIPSFFLSPSEALHGALGCIQKNDILILFSRGGESAEINRMASGGRKKGAKILTICENEKSELVKLSDDNLKINYYKELDKFNLLATNSAIITLAVFDIIAVAIKDSSSFSKQDFLLNHPGGAVGGILRNID